MVLSDPLTIIGVYMLGAGTGALVTYARNRHVMSECRKALELSSVNVSANRGAKPHLGLKALLTGWDREMVFIFSHLFHEMNIETQNCFSEAAAIDQFSSDRFDAVVLDFDDIGGCAEMLEALRRTPANRQAIVIAVASTDRAKEIGSEVGAFTIERPLAPSQIRDLIRTTYGRMLRDRMAYFRLPVELPVSIRRRSGTLLQCATINLSERGMAVSTPSPLQIGEPLNIVFAIPNADLVVSAEGSVIWDDKHGKAGIHFECASLSVKARFSGWLHDQFFNRVNNSSINDDISQHVAVTHSRA